MKPRPNLFKDSTLAFLDVYHTKDGKPKLEHILNKDYDLQKFASVILLPLVMPLNIYTISDMIQPKEDSERQIPIIKVFLSIMTLLILGINVCLTFKFETYAKNIAPYVASISFLSLVMVRPSDCVSTSSSSCETVVKINIFSYVMAQAIIISLICSKAYQTVFTALIDTALFITIILVRSTKEPYETDVSVCTIISILLVILSFLASLTILLSVKHSVKSHLTYLIEVASFSTS
jgi:hypothetical protein